MVVAKVEGTKTTWLRSKGNVECRMLILWPGDHHVKIIIMIIQ